MRTPEALNVFGPSAFGFDEEFTPIEEINRSTSLREWKEDLV
jgi:hypothetical protein